VTTFTIFADSNDASIKCSDASYSNARAGTGTLTLDAGTASTETAACGQQLAAAVYSVMEIFQQYDTSSIGAGATITAGTLSFTMSGSGDRSDTDFVINAYSHDWGGGAVTTGDFVAGADFGGLTKIAALNTSGIVTLSYNDLTSEAAMLTEINPTGYTNVLIASANTGANTAPTGDEYFSMRMADFSGTTSDPKLVVVATLPVDGTLTKTLDNFTLASAGTVAVAGALAKTLGDFTLQSTIITESPGSLHVRHNGAWQEPTVWVKHNGNWVEPVGGYVNQSGTWKRVL